jgi:hypothetical protein
MNLAGLSVYSVLHLYLLSESCILEDQSVLKITSFFVTTSSRTTHVHASIHTPFTKTALLDDKNS